MTNKEIKKVKNSYNKILNKRSHLYDSKYGYIYILPGVITLALITLGPFLYDLFLSFTNKNLATTEPLGFVGFENYISLIRDEVFWIAVFTTFKYVFFTVAIEMLLGFIMALLFQINFKGKRIIRSLLLLPMVATPIAVGFMWRIIYNPSSGILNYLLGLINITGIEWVSAESTALASVILVDVWQWTPFVYLILNAGISALPDAPFESAIVDGASLIQLITKVMYPLLKPIIAIALVFRLVDSFKTFDTIYILTGGGPGMATETLNIQTFLNAFKYLKMGKATALSIILIIIIILICNYITKRGGFNLE